MKDRLVEVRAYILRSLQKDIKDMAELERRSMSSQFSVLLAEAVGERKRRQERALRKAQQDGQ